MSAAGDLGTDVFGKPHSLRRLRLSGKAKGNIAFAVFFLVVGSAWFALLRPPALGGSATYVMVRGISMEPTYHTGDLIIARAQAAYSVGDIVAYKVPKGDVGAGLTVIHRIIGGSASSGFVTRGDNNPAPDDWRPKLGDIEGKAWLVIPKGGLILAFLHAPVPMAALAASVAVAMIVYGKGNPPVGADPKRRRRRAGSGDHGGGTDQPAI